VLGLGLTQVRAQEGEVATLQTETPKEQSVVGKIIDDLKENTRTVHEINKQNLAAEKEAFRVRYEEATKADPDFKKFRQAKGLKNKMAAVTENIKEGCRENSKKERERREQITSFKSYKNLLAEQRTKRETATTNQ
jgi:hypothetical protein